MAVDPLANALNSIKVAELKGKPEATAKPASNLIKEVLLVMQRENFVQEFEFVDDGRGGWFRVKLLGRINDAGAIKPRFSVKSRDWEHWEARYLPARGIGLIIVSTPRGLMSHKQAKQEGVGGRLIAYVY
jgi:small subunit ribosomal protein S8